MSGATIHDVAKAAGVSIATVSYVLNNSRRVGDETRARVLSAATQLGYHANITARNLQASETRLIGYSWRPSLPSQFNPILDQFVHAIADAANVHGYRILAFPSPDAASELDAYRNMMRMRQVDGFILSNTEFDDERVRELARANFPFVSFGRANTGWAFRWVDVDGQEGVRLATEHLLAQGHQKIAFLAWPAGSQTGYYRREGYLAAMRTAQLPVVGSWLAEAGNFHDEAYAATRRLLDLPPAARPTAIVASSDLMAMGVINAGWDAGLVVGRDLAVVGFDDAPVARFLRPALSSIAQPIVEVGETLIEMLIATIRGEQLAQPGVMLAPSLVVRESSNFRWQLS